MKVIYMGTPDFAVETLKSVAKHHEVLAVFTQPDKPKGRGKKLASPPVKLVAEELGFTVYQPDKIRKEHWPTLIKDYKPDVIVVVAYGQILSQEILDIPKFGCINVHGSLLPSYRGAAPINWAIADGLETTGVTTMLMAAGIDTGDMLLKSEVSVDRKTAGELFEELAVVGADLLIETLEQLEKGTIIPVPQIDAESSHAMMLDKNVTRIDWHMSAKQIENRIRGFNPWPIAHTQFDEVTFKIFSAKNLDNEEFNSLSNLSASDLNILKTSVPGEIVFKDKKAIYVKTGEGVLRVDELQLGSNKRMLTQAFLLGNDVEIGKILI
jgi:methionyl-tRNA formyltransferase (EC 2.1.2.9)